MSEFHVFGDMVAASFQRLAGAGELYTVDLYGDLLWQHYLSSFPEGTNPQFRERTEHDCNCCKSFVRRIAGVVDENMNTVWDEACADAPHPYNLVAQAMREAVLGSQISDVFRVPEAGYGAQTTRSTHEGELEVWHHFHTGEIPGRFLDTSQRGQHATNVAAFERALVELQPGALDQVLELIDANSLYRGTEHRKAVEAVRSAQLRFEEAEDKRLFLWTRANQHLAHFRGSAIGVLVQDLSEGKDLERAVKTFEKRVAPQNYKRTSAPATPGMVKQAMKTIEELGLLSAIPRRFAVIEDVGVNDVLWVDGQVRPLMKGGMEEFADMIMAHAEKVRGHNGDVSRAKAMSVDDFMSKILPEAKSLDLLFQGQHMSNLMSLTAPVDPEPRQLFAWGNDFAWSYVGDIADSSIRERVKKAGGQVTGVQLRCSLSWYNTDDLDIHVRGPGGHIHFSRKRGTCGGQLDVDMNVRNLVRDAVENVVWRKVPDGVYKVSVHNYTHRESRDVGFVVEVENAGGLQHFAYDNEVRNGQEVPVATLHMRQGLIETLEVHSGIQRRGLSQDKWGLTTEDYVKVNAVTLSPNHWHGQAQGNKHTFFVLEGCANDEPCRGIYNEFLHPRLTQHRRVFELIGAKTKCQPTDGQLSGLGFSSTKPDAVVIRVDNQHLYRVQFGGRS
jgi:hypothetical protein